MLNVYVNNKTTKLQRKNDVVKIQCIVIVGNILRNRIFGSTTNNKNNNFKGVTYYLIDK